MAAGLGLHFLHMSEGPFSHDAGHIILIVPISSPNPLFDHLLESANQDDSNKWSNKGFVEEICQVQSNLVISK